MRVLDLYSGLGGWSSAFTEHSHSVTTVDIEPKFQPTIVADIAKLEAKDLPGPWHMILASPDCRFYSVLAIRHHWTKYGDPLPRTREATKLVWHTLDLIRKLNPRFWVLENPRGMLRKAIGPPAATVTYCQYGAPYMKPTDLWGWLPPAFKPRRCSPGDKCHEAVPRGASNRTGDRGRKNWHGGGYWDGYTAKWHSSKRAVVMAKIPRGLSMAMCLAAEKSLGMEAWVNVPAVEIPS